MKSVQLSDVKEQIEFVEKAAAHFETHLEHRTFTDGDIEAGCLFGVRWGGGNDCVLVLKVDELFDPIVYGQAIDTEAPAILSDHRGA